MELDVDDLVGEPHETDEHGLEDVSGLCDIERGRKMTYVHEDGDNHELGVEADEGLILLQVVLLDESLLDGSEEIPVQSGVDDEDDDLGDSIPDIIDLDPSTQQSVTFLDIWWMHPNLRLTRRRNSMRRDPNNKNSNVDKRNDNRRAPFQLKDSRSMLSDDRNSVDDNLKKQLDLPDPKEQNEEKNRDTRDRVSQPDRVSDIAVLTSGR